VLVRSQRFRFGNFLLALLQVFVLEVCVAGHMHRSGGGTSSSAAPLVGVFPSGSAPCSCFGW
jgi:hypothetical protein